MKKKLLRAILVILLISVVLLVGTYAAFVAGLAYSNDLTKLERAMHPCQQTDTLWISEEEDLYLINDGGTFSAYVLWNGAWQQATLEKVGARFQLLLLDDEPLLRGNFSMRREDRFQLRCSSDSPMEEAFANGRKRLVLRRYDLRAYIERLPFSYPV